LGGRIGRMLWLKKWWVIAILAVVALYGALVIYRVFAIGVEEKTARAVERIHGQKLVMDDVLGVNMPPVPDPALVDATVEGVDANENGIRDDVELAIFEKYPDSARTRAPMLQYARALQMEFTEVFNSETLVAVIQEEDRGYFCAGDVFQSTLLDETIKNVENLVLNTEAREKKYKESRTKYMTSYGDIKGKFDCDLDILL